MLYQGFDDDREYLINKFRAPVMDPATGLSNDEIRAKILDAVATWKEQPVSMIKGHGFEFICRNMHCNHRSTGFYTLFVFPHRMLWEVIMYGTI